MARCDNLSIGLSIPNIIHCFVKRSKCDILHANVDLQSVLNFLNTKAALFGRIQNGMICVTYGSELRLDLPTSRPQNFLERKRPSQKFLCFRCGKKRRALRKPKLRRHQHRNIIHHICCVAFLSAKPLVKNTFFKSFPAPPPPKKRNRLRL